MSVPGAILFAPDQTDKTIRAHADCAVCHDKKSKENPVEPYINPDQNQCARCHAAPRAGAAVVSTSATVKKDREVLAFLDTPLRWQERISPKFSHSRDEHQRGQQTETDEAKKGESREAKCATCHTGILNSPRLENLKPVPIASCWYCHSQQETQIPDEVAKRKKDPKFVCIYCHTTDVGRRATPDDHLKLTKP